jgi:hypothetical protein
MKKNPNHLLQKCQECLELKPLDDFYNRRSGKECKCKTCKSEYYKKRNANPEINARNKSFNKNYYQNNKDKMLSRNRMRYENKKQEIKEQIKNRWNNLSEVERGILRKKRQENKKANPNYKAIKAHRRRLAKTINKKTCKTIEVLGCSPLELRLHLESLWTEGMSWDNYGFKGWHIDHKIPIALFDLSCPEQMKICFHYTNLQPLWAKDNLSKGATPHF